MTLPFYSLPAFRPTGFGLGTNLAWLKAQGIGDDFLRTQPLSTRWICLRCLIRSHLMFEDERSRHNCRKLWMRVAGELFALCHCLHCLTMWSAFCRQTKDNHTWLLCNFIDANFGEKRNNYWWAQMLKTVLLGKQITNTRYFIEKKQKTAFYWEKHPKKKLAD